MDKCCIVLNPEARASRKFAVASKIAVAAPRATVRLTEGPGHAEFIARKAVAQGFETIVAGGGDGTVNEVLRGITGTDVRLGVLPLGTMNVFARELKLPLEWQAAWNLIACGHYRRVDLGWANHMPVAQLAGVGFDAAAIARVHPGLKRRLGPAAYVWAGIQQLFAPMPLLTITAEGQAPIQGVWVVLGTGRYYGCPIPIFPNARNGDGLWNVLVIRNLRPQCLFKGLLTLPLGRHLDLDEISHFQTRRLRVELASGSQGNPALEVDGELRGFTPVEFWIEQNVLRVAAP
jgi:YegS/Rv2252/BmrU family lipid kinase